MGSNPDINLISPCAPRHILTGYSWFKTDHQPNLHGTDFTIPISFLFFLDHWDLPWYGLDALGRCATRAVVAYDFILVWLIVM